MLKQNTQNGFSVVEVSIVIGVVAIVGALGWRFYDAQTNKTAANNVSTQSTVDIKPTALSDLAEISTIQKDALTDKSGITVVHVELEQTSSGKLVYKVQLSDGTVTVYDAKTGARTKSSTEAVKSTEILPANFTTGIGFAKALEIARAEKPASKVYKIELELEGGIVVYSVRFSDKARVDVNAQDGTIVRTKAAKAETAPNKTEDNSASSTSHSGSSSSSTHSTAQGSSASDDSGHHSGSDDSGSHHDDSDNLSDSDDDDDDDSSNDDNDSKSSDDNSGSGSNRR